MSDVKEFRLGELFCGPGGLALGAITARINNPEYKIVHKWANDYDASTCETYRRNINPMITFLYSAAGICPQSTQAASQICFSKPIAAVFFSAI